MRVTSRSERCGGLVAVVLMLVVCAPAKAAPAWLTPTGLPPGNEELGEPKVAVTAEGESIAVWESYSKGLEEFVVEAATRPAGGTWEAPAAISAASTGGLEPQIALNSAGDATVVWSLGEGSGKAVVQLTTHAPGGRWQTPTNVSPAGEDETGNPIVAVDARGDTAVAWADYDTKAKGSFVRTSTETPGGTWTTPQTLTPSAGQNYPAAITLDTAGNGLVLWLQLNGATFELWSAERPAGGEWQGTATLSSSGHSAGYGQLALSASGEATAFWTEQTSGDDYAVQAAEHAAGGSWQKPLQLSSGEKDIGSLIGVMNPAGDEEAAWAEELEPDHYVLEARARPAGGAWSAPAEIAKTTESSFALVLDPHDYATILWRKFNEANYGVFAARSATGGAWQSAGEISEPAQEARYPQIASDATGNLTAVWDTEKGGKSGIQALGFDDAGPELNGVSIPASGNVGVPVTFSVSPFDVWSALGATGWQFGDGSSASGAGVTHTYTSPGTYAVTLSSEDALGNLTTTSGSIVISAEPSPASKTLTKPSVEAPRITHLSESHRRWREGSKSAVLSRSKRPPLGTVFSFTLSQASRVTLSFTQGASGFLVGGKCVKPSRSNRRHKRCRRTLSRGSLTYAASAGAHRIAFQGRLAKGRHLPLGAYSVRVQATNTTTGNRSAVEALSFTIVL